MERNSMETSVSADIEALKDVLTHFARSRNFPSSDASRHRLLSKSLSSRMPLTSGPLRSDFVSGESTRCGGSRQFIQSLSSRCQPGPRTSTAAAWRHSDEAFHDVLFRPVADVLYDRLLPVWPRLWRRSMWSMWWWLWSCLPVQ